MMGNLVVYLELRQKGGVSLEDYAGELREPFRVALGKSSLHLSARGAWCSQVTAGGLGPLFALKGKKLESFSKLQQENLASLEL